MRIELFIPLLTICAAITSLVVEAFKSTNWFKSYNLLALVVSLLVGGFTCVAAYCNLHIPFDFLNILYIIAFSVINWLCSTLGYDKVMQTIKQFLGE